MKPLYNPLFVKFIVYFNENQDFFECHEVLEEYWKDFPDRTKEHPLVGYILLATAMYHWRRGNTIGAGRSLKKAISRLEKVSQAHPGFSEGINIDSLLKNSTHAYQQIKNEKPFSTFPIEITSPKIQALNNEIKPTMDLLPYGSDDVIHKHMLRDRSDILKEREKRKRQGRM
ncbi:DUF309 domain-containing protein [Sporosarcina sp. Marseille-Q4063]|uniref:DUF309 domain-containing protein n=1 Tax=Sporosarcina sp. Marseille-Q4063 TaxID=2810514 RepID=UPI001BAE7A13|nr:DUF309 domain-containing protein [Sporosarcina sp. Marseille-Q4063]QUW22077.1 DUF309 domain-containing protein [Sporosarcina sp. Marseille-Q4063]